MIRFLICNLFISGIIGILLLAKRIFKNSLTSRMQYNLWFLLLISLTVPFLPVRLAGFLQIFSFLGNFENFSRSNTEAAFTTPADSNPSGTVGWINDFTLSVSRETPSIAGSILFGIWIAGILAMIVLVIKSVLRIRALKSFALPLQNPEVRKLYARCLDEMNITSNIPIYSTAHLKSPVIVGFLKPCIYLPLHLISEYNDSDMRYMLLHELQHYRHKDAVGNYMMNLAGIVYWFNPIVWFALKEMRNDREIACDTSVLMMLADEDYADYGNTLINFAEKISLTPFPFAAGLRGSMKQMKRCILNIASYEKPTFRKRMKGIAAFTVTAVVLSGAAPILSTYAAGDNRYEWNISDKNISYLDVSAYFEGFEGSFVLYDLKEDHWNIYDMEHAAARVAPNSTYKIYDSLFALEEGIITPENSFIAWDNKKYPFEAWNTDQTLQSAMASSVNWYFQSLDRQLGKSILQSYIQKIKYGNENISGDLSSYWMESSLKISPLEQVALLASLYNNSFGFTPENIQTVKESIRLSSSANGTLYGKTGTGQVDGQDVNGWFVGFVETAEQTCFFAANIKAGTNAAGSNASGIVLSILSDMNIWK